MAGTWITGGPTTSSTGSTGGLGGLGGGNLGIMAGDQIDQSFAPIYGKFGPTSGGGTGPGGLQPQPVSGGDNDLTRYLRSLGNLMGAQGPQFIGAGENVLGTAMGVEKTGLDVMAGGLGTLQTPEAFYQKLASGDPRTMTSVLAPTAANIANITAGATNQASQDLPGGGYRAAAMAGLPFSQAAQVGNAALGLQPAAEEALTGIGTTQAGIGQAMGSLGSQIGLLGTTLTSQGLGALQTTLNALLQKQQINVQEAGNLFSALV